MKDGINDYVVHGVEEAVNPERTGTKAAAHYQLDVAPGETAAMRLRLTDTTPHAQESVRPVSTGLFAPAHERSRRVLRDGRFRTICSDDAQQRDAPGLRGHAVVASSFTTMWCNSWLDGDPGQPAAAAGAPPRAATTIGRILYNADVISMPDKWEYPWYAAWDLAFHCVPLALVDPDFAKEQLDPDAARVVHAPQRADCRPMNGPSAT